MMVVGAAVRVCRSTANAAAVPPCRFHWRPLSAIAATSVKAPRQSSTCAGSMPTTTGLVSSGHFARRAYISSSSTRLHPDDNDILYLPMPKLSPSMTRATVTKWLKEEGDEVNEYDAVLELSTDTLYAPGDAPVEGASVDMIVELAEAGFVGKLFVGEGDSIKVGQAVMAMCEEEENVEELRNAKSPGVDFYSDGGETGLRIATYQGYLNGKTTTE